ncbi:hypothetical protein P154DRAFT_521755 [Amniculicola lignicola CBS 123094]|uniref:Uncharacterized protein n=1 Tax=Amniculicola lignicola CBS 123094 TaxID=1392246 RepID=A0A6A5WUS9_9PLEO|nr:hypothetical protein P154DRAFT_521755 [Amniculicola lignicola CBS 123094]
MTRRFECRSFVSSRQSSGYMLYEIAPNLLVYSFSFSSLSLLDQSANQCSNFQIYTMQSHPSLFLRGCLASIALHSLMHIANAASIPLGLQTSSGFYSTPRPQSSNSQNINLGISDTRLLFGELLHTTFKSDVAIIDDWLYMSWADAARIEYVVVETNPEVFPPDHHVHPKQEQLTTMKIGDENPIEIFLEQDLFVRLLAVDKWGRILGSTEAVKLPEV